MKGTAYSLPLDGGRWRPNGSRMRGLPKGQCTVLINDIKKGELNNTIHSATVILLIKVVALPLRGYPSSVRHTPDSFPRQGEAFGATAPFIRRRALPAEGVPEGTVYGFH